jgi:CRISPR system Cascade subunit CasD
MSGQPSTLLFRLVGPMQSWGFRSRFDNRDTALEPTRSGVIGLFCAALGWARDADLKPFHNLKMGVRVDAPGRVMVDYQTASEVIRANGNPGGTVQSWRYYLSDARFLVGLESEDLDWLRELDDALRNPVYPLFLGRKSYVPSLPIALPRNGVLENVDLESALGTQAWRYLREAEKRELSESRRSRLRLRIETTDFENGSASNDFPLDFARRRFRPRVVREGSIAIAPEQVQKDELCIFRY